MITFELITQISESQKLKKILELLKNLSPFYEKSSKMIEDYIQERFDSEGGNFESWLPKSKAAVRRNGLTLTDTKKMRLSFIRGNPNNINVIKRDSLVFGTKYRVENKKNGDLISTPRVHHFGSKDMIAFGKFSFTLPARPIITLSPQMIRNLRFQLKKEFQNVIKQ